MAVKVTARHFDPHLAAHRVELENSLGVKHVMTIHIGDHEACPTCGHALNRKNGVVDVDATIAAAKKEFEAHERKLLVHMRKKA
jgi:hypothetical protein